MSEDIDNLSAEAQGGNTGEEAIWKTGPDDPGLPVKVVERRKTAGGGEWVQIEGSDNWIPAEHIHKTEPGAGGESSEQQAEMVTWSKSGETHRVIKRFTTRGGNDFVRLEGVDRPVPADQVYEAPDAKTDLSDPEDLRSDEEVEEELYGEPVMWYKPGEDPIEVREVAEQDGDHGKEIMIQVGSSFEWVPAEQVRRLGEEAVEQVLEIKEEAESTVTEDVTNEGEASRQEEEKTAQKAAAENEPEDAGDIENEPVKVLPRGTRLARRGKPGFEVETINKRPNSGKEYYVIIQKDAEGRVTARTNEDVDAMQRFLEEGSKWQLEEEAAESTQEASSLSAEELRAQKTIIDYLTPRIKILEDRADNPASGDGLQLARLKALMQKVVEGKFTERAEFSGRDDTGNDVRRSNSVLSYFGRVRAFSDEGSGPYKNADHILAVLRDAGIDVEHVEELVAQEDADNGGQGNNDNKKTAQNPDNSNGNNNKHNMRGNHERDSEKSPWLDPRRIQELRAQYEEALGANRAFVSESVKDHLKTIIIEREIARVFKHARRIQEVYGVGQIPEAPTDGIKKRMAEMMDIPLDEIGEKASKRDEQILEEASGFKKNDRVKIKRADGSMEDGWRVKGYSHTPNTKPMVHIVKGRESRYLDPDILRQYQEEANPDTDKVNLEKLKPYFNSKAKVKTGEGVVEGYFQGYKPSYGFGEGKIYYGNSDGVRIGEASVDDFLSWQTEKTTAEQEAEELAELERKVAAYSKGQKVKVKDVEGKFHPGFTFDKYVPDEKKVVVAYKDGSLHDIELKIFIQTQEEPGGEDTIADDEEEEEKKKSGISEPTRPPAAPEEAKKEEKIPLSWWEKTKKQYDRLPNPAKPVVGLLGIVAMTPLVGWGVGGAMAVQHKLLKRRLRKEKEAKLKAEEEKAAREKAAREAGSPLPA
jgi:hypothetical protein